MKKTAVIVGIITWFGVLLSKPKKANAPTCKSEPIKNQGLVPGSLLFSPMGKRESKYVGHVGIVTNDQHVIHSIPSGLIKDPLNHYKYKFKFITIYEPIDPCAGKKAAIYAETLYEKHPSAAYRFLTPLSRKASEQYCTKIVWQSYFYGADINLGNLLNNARAIHPILLKDKHYLKKLKFQ